MNIYPYVYRIDHPSGEFYIGYRCANTVPAEQDLGHKYKTSATQLSYPFEEYSITIVAEFFMDTAKTDAYDFEQALIFEHWGNQMLANKACHHGNKGRFSRVGQNHSEEHRAKISEAMSGQTRSKETKQKMSDAHRGKPGKKHSDESRAKMSRKTISAEHRAKISEAQRGRTHSAESKLKMSEARRRR